MFRLALRVAALALIAGVARAEEPDLRRYERVEIAPTKTSIYVGSVSMTMPPFVRAGSGAFESTYVAKVFPFFFQSESGRLSVAFSDDALRRLERGERVEFTGQAVATNGDERRVEGHATPDAPGVPSGKIKVRVFVSKRIELIFNTTYRFPDSPSPPK